VAVVCCLLGMVSKEVTATLPLMLIVYDRVFTRWSLGEQFKRRGALYGLLLAMALWFPARVLISNPAAFWEYLAQGEWFKLLGLSELDTSAKGKSAGFSYEALTWWQYALTQALVLLKYLKLSIVPYPLVLDYMHPAQHTLLAPDSGYSRPVAWALILAPVITIAALLVVTGFGLVRRRPWAFCAAWFFGVLAITSSVIPIADLMVEHRMYLPLAGVIALLVLGGYWLLGRVAGAQRRAVPEPAAVRLLGAALAGAVIVAFSVLTVQRNREYVGYEDALGRYYSGRVHIWQTVVERRPANPRGWHNLCTAYAKLADVSRGTPRHDELKNEALACWRRVLELTPTFDAAWNEIGGIHLRRGEYAQAERCLREAIHLNPGDASYRHNLGAVYLAKKEWDAAAEQYEEAVAINPDYAEAFNNLGIVRSQQGRMDEAIELVSKSVELHPGNTRAWINLAMFRLDRRQYEEARAAMERAFQLDRGSEEARRNCVAVALAFARAGRFEDAADMLDWAIQSAQAARESERLLNELRVLREEFRAGRVPAELGAPGMVPAPRGGRGSGGR